MATHEQIAKAIADDFSGQTFSDPCDTAQWLERRITKALRDAARDATIAKPNGEERKQCCTTLSGE